MKTSDHQDYYDRKLRRATPVAMMAVLLAFVISGAAVIVKLITMGIEMLGGGL